MNDSKHVYQNKIIWPLFIYLLLIVLLKLINVENLLINKFSVSREFASSIDIQIGYLVLLIIPFLLTIELVRRKRKYSDEKTGISIFSLTFFIGVIAGGFFGYGFCGVGHADNIFDYIAPCLFFPLLIAAFTTGFLGVIVDLIWDKLSKINSR